MSNRENPADPGRVAMGLRTTGYEFVTAAADIIDNSIAANAKRINVSMAVQDDGRRFVYFGDDGDGMDEDELFSAMKYGSPERDNPESLGKFGLGLKTASSAICLKYSALSRKTGSKPIRKLTWDLDHIGKTNRWEHPPDDDVTADEKQMFTDLCGEKGTLIVWSKCDRLLTTRFDQPGGTKERTAITKLGNKLREHCSLVYHRFLDHNDTRARNITIFVDGYIVESWDPFFTTHDSTVQLLPENAQTVECELEDGSTAIAHMKAWMLPHNDNLTKSDKNLAKITNNRQGFYIHRHNRVIHSGNWLGLWINEPHHVLLRIEFDFDYTLDSAFRLTIDKAKIEFDPELYTSLKTRLLPLYQEARKQFDKTSKQKARKGIDHESSDKTIVNTDSVSKPTVVTADPETDEATIKTTRGENVKIKVRVGSNVPVEQVVVAPVEDIHNGSLWEPTLRSPGVAEHQVAVSINTHHDYYQKIYQRAKSNGYAVNGIDYLLWAFSSAEINNTSESTKYVFEDMRTEISNNLSRLLRDLDIPDDLEPAED